MLDIGQSENTVFLQIQNSKKPEQIISIVLIDSTGEHFETRGLRDLFGIEEIWIERDDLLAYMEEYALLFSYLLETMSAAQDFNLPYAYMETFEYKGQKYSLTSRNGYRVLRRANGRG
ncbi:MAG: hypothetical protein LLG06_18070 [Desulfobacteraceae bacterium]|nr:hypothetical protein [Desulfobacteraceae bacterium]